MYYTATETQISMENEQAPPTILIVDDDVAVRSFLQSLLESQGYRVIPSESALQALRLLRQGVQRPDLFIVDYSMYGMNGFELIRELRQREDAYQIPVLMLTATNKVIKDAVELEGVEYLSKSSSNQTILDALEKMLRSPQRNTSKSPIQLTQAPEPQTGFNPHAPVEIIRLYKDTNASPQNQVLPSIPAGQQTPLPTWQQSSGRVIDPVDIYKTPSENQSPPLRQNPAPIYIDPPPSAENAPGPINGQTTSFASEAAGFLDDNARDLAALSSALSEKFINSGISQGQPDVEFLTREASQKESPAIRFIESLLADAVQRRASDIHIEPQQDGLQVRLRIDGALQPLIRLPSAFEPVIAARVKILTNLNITERRLSQDGSFSRQTADGRKVEFRVSTLPSLYGEKVVLRILRSGQLQVKLNSLGFSPRNEEIVNGALKASTGIILVTGPTGSGKTSTLYSMLDILNKPNRNIVTVEDPIEYQLPGITQVQVHTEIGYTFDRILRSILRQDPNIILVGEIRDAETGSIALKASVTGHLVLSTIHTNDAPSTTHRLISMGLPSHLVAAACRVIIAQRLIRLLCPECKVESTLTQEESCQLTSEETQQLPRVWRPKGCPHCKSIGYQGRRAIFEVMPVLSHAMKQLIVEQASPDKIRELAFMEGMVSLRQEALSLVAEGLTTPEEAFSVLYAA